MKAWALFLLAFAAWNVFVVASCSVFALRAYLEDRRTARLGDFLLQPTATLQSSSPDEPETRTP